MFGDGLWLPHRTDSQMQAFDHWAVNLNGQKLVVIEIGAGTAIPSVRHVCEQMSQYNGTLIRINPREAHGPKGTISLPMGGAAALQAIQGQLER